MQTQSLRDELMGFLAREEKSLRQWAIELGIKPGYLSQIINGERTPALALAVRMQKETGLPIEMFIADSAA